MADFKARLASGRMMACKAHSTLEWNRSVECAVRIHKLLACSAGPSTPFEFTETSHTGHSNVRFSLPGVSSLIRASHIAEPHRGQVGWSIDESEGADCCCGMTLPSLWRERCTVSQSPTPKPWPVTAMPARARIDAPSQHGPYSIYCGIRSRWQIGSRASDISQCTRHAGAATRSNNRIV